VLAAASPAAAQFAPFPGRPAPTSPIPRDSVAAAVADTSVIPVAPGEIPFEADRTMIRTAKLLAAGARREVATIMAEAAPRRDSVLAEERITTLREKGLVTRRGLADLRVQWSVLDQEVSEARRTLLLATVEIDTAKRELGRELARWRATARSQAQLGSTPELVVRARQVVSGLERIETVIREREADILEAELALSESATRIFIEQQALSAALTEERRRLLRIDSPPLWESLRSGHRAALAGGLQRTLGELQWFARSYTPRIVLHLLALLGMTLMALPLRRSITETAEHAIPDRRYYGILRRPVAALLLVGITLALWLYPRAPLAMYDVVLVLAAVPLWFLIPGLVPDDLVPASRVAVVMLVLQRLLIIATLGTPPYRVAHLAYSAAGVLVLWWGLRTGGVLARREPAWRSAIQNVAWLLFWAFVGAILANVLGNVTLADTVNAGVALSAFLAILLAAATQVVDVFLSEAIKIGARHSYYLRRRGAQLDQVLTRLTTGLAIVVWIGFTLTAFNLYQPAMSLVGGVVGASFAVGKVSISVGAILLFVAMLWAGLVLARLVSSVLELDVFSRMDMRHGAAVTVASLVRYALITIAFLVAVSAMGVKLSDVAIIGGALGVGIGFGLQNVVNNFVSGLLLAFERPVSIGDTVQVGPHLGDVKEIGIRASVILTADGAEVIVPNSELITQDVINWTRTDARRRFEVKVGVAYGTDPARVLPLLRSAVMSHPRILADPPPMLLFQEFGESALIFAVRAWTDDPMWPIVRSDLSIAIDAALRREGIEIPFPQRDLHLRSVDTRVAEALRAEPTTLPRT
jgi:small-conductance mechanosensitive channel